MAGAGQRFKEAGYDLPKPFIDVHGRPMIARVIDSLKPIMDSYEKVNLILLARKEHITKYGLIELIEQYIGPNVVPIFIPVEELTAGAACTALLAKQYIDNYNELLIVNSDQIIKYNTFNFMTLLKNASPSAVVFTFNDTDKKWSFVKTDNFNIIREVAEKNPISNLANCGVFWYEYGSDFIDCAETMIREDIRVNGEFYIAPVFNIMMRSRNNLILPFMVNEMHGIGTPDDLRVYLERTK